MSVAAHPISSRAICGGLARWLLAEPAIGWLDASIKAQPLLAASLGIMPGLRLERIRTGNALSVTALANRGEQR